MLVLSTTKAGNIHFAGVGSIVDQFGVNVIRLFVDNRQDNRGEELRIEAARFGLYAYAI
jgi:hypothetical protein